jgi:hypothetical protein
MTEMDPKIIILPFEMEAHELARDVVYKQEAFAGFIRQHVKSQLKIWREIPRLALLAEKHPEANLKYAWAYQRGLWAICSKTNFSGQREIEDEENSFGPTGFLYINLKNADLVTLGYWEERASAQAISNLIKLPDWDNLINAYSVRDLLSLEAGRVQANLSTEVRNWQQVCLVHLPC